MRKVIYLASNAGGGAGGNNTRARFTCPLAEPLENASKLDVKILSISFEAKFLTICNTPNRPSIIVIHPTDKILRNKIKIVGTNIVNIESLKMKDPRMKNCTATAVEIASIRTTSVNETLVLLFRVIETAALSKYVKISKVNKGIGIKMLKNALHVLLSKNISKLLGFATLPQQLEDYVSYLHTSALFVKFSNTSGHFMRLFTHKRTIANTSDYDFDRNLFLPKAVSIELPQTCPVLAGSAFSSLAIVSPAPAENNGTVFTFSPQTPTTSSVNVSLLDKIQVILRDSYTLEKVKFSSGTATYLTIEISERNVNEMSTVINCFSNDRTSAQKNPQNHPMRFTSFLAQYLTIGSSLRWSLKLLSFSMTSRIKNVTTDIAFFDAYSLTRKRKTVNSNSVNDKETSKHVFRCYFQSDLYETVPSLVDNMNLALSHVYEETETHLKFWFDMARDGRVSVRNTSTTNERGCAIVFPVGLKAVIGCPLTEDEFDIVMHGEDVSVCRLSPDLNAAAPKYIKITCNQLESSSFADQKLPVLAFFPIDSAVSHTGTSRFYEFLNPCDVGLNLQYLSQLDFIVSTGSSDYPLETCDDKDLLTPTHLFLQLNRISQK